MQRYMSTTSRDCTDDDTVNNYVTESMAYNADGQLASRGFVSGQDECYVVTSENNGITYSYSATQNNGQITQARDTMSGETISYTYDALKRLTEASATPISGSTPAAWTQAYGYDGFGNMTSKVLNGGANTIPAVNAATNRFSTSGYDANGNSLSAMGATLTYDEENRVVSASPTSGGTAYYGYAPDHKRIYQGLPWRWGLQEQWTFFGAYGEKLGVFAWVDYTQSGDCGICALNPVSWNVWFAGKMIWNGQGTAEEGTSAATYQDRVGTNRAFGARFYPYGEEITSTGNDREKFATYQRDSFTMLDYADQRYYASSYGRFTSVDPGPVASKDPGTWNRYSYVGGDPVNRMDPGGACWYDPETGATTEDWDVNYDEIFTQDLQLVTGGCDQGPEYEAALNMCNQMGQETDWSQGGYYCGSPVSGTSTTISQPPCDIELRTAPIPIAGRVGAVHSYLDVVDANGVTHILEGIQSSVKKSFFPGLTYLNGSDTLTGGLNIDNLASNPILFDSANNPALTNICDDVSALINAADNFPVNKVRYDLLGKIFPNSNSFIRYLLTFIPNLGITAPPGAVGWSKPVLGQ